MTPLQLELTRLIGKKELTFGAKIILKDYIGEKTINQIIEGYFFEVCGNIGRDFYMNDVEEIIGHPANLSDFHRWMNENKRFFEMTQTFIRWGFSKDKTITYDSSKDLLDQDESVLKQIVELIKA